MSTVLRFSLCLLILSLSLCSKAQTIYKCPGEGENGSLLYSETPCQSPEGGRVPYDESKITPMDSMSSSEIRTLNFLERDNGRTKYERASSAPYRTPRSPSNSGCDAARKSLRAWQIYMKEGYPAARSRYMHEELHRRMNRRDAACY